MAQRQVRCLVCRRPLKKAHFLCELCGRSYDRAVDRDNTTAAIIRWAVDRALLIERRRNTTRKRTTR